MKTKQPTIIHIADISTQILLSGLRFFLPLPQDPLHPLPGRLYRVLRCTNNQKGMALLLTISLVSVLAIVTLRFSQTMRQEYIVSAGLKNSVRLGEMARSGVTIAEEILLLDRQDNSYDSLHDSWALLADEDLTSLFEQGSLKVSVADETGKFQINAMVIRKRKDSNKTDETTNPDDGGDGDADGEGNVDGEGNIDGEGNSEEGEGKKKLTEEEKQKQRESDVRNILWRLLREEPFLVEDGDARGIIDSLIDWIDSGDADGEEEYGAEDSYYQSLDPPYSCKNGPIESIEELLLVKGFSRELLYGTEETPPLAPLLTALGNDGRININTAGPSLLQALAFDLDKGTVEAMISFREDENNKEQLVSNQWYKDVPSFPGDIAEIIKKQDLVTIAGRYFTIAATAEFNSQTKTIISTVERASKEIAILKWQSE
ncbi:MAG: general secretion pathway protein GspK [Desulfocapsa sp.]|nr:general secretion pathway protein GspK [Desulfocapsa sp.]